MNRLKALLMFTAILTIQAQPVFGGELSFEVIPSTQVLNVGDTLTLTMRVKVFGMPERFDAEPFSKLELPGFRTISTAPTHRRGVESDLEFEERITTFRLVAEEAGDYTIPAFQIPYHDAAGSNDKYLNSQELAITVNPSKSGDRRPANAVMLIGAFLLVILVSVVGFLLWMKKIKSSRFKEEEEVNIKTKFGKWADELQKLLATGKTDTFTQQAFNFVNEYIEDNYQLGLKGQKIEKRMMIIKDKGVHEGLIDLFRKTHENLEQLKFGGLTLTAPELSKLLDELKDIEKYTDASRSRN